MWLMLAVCAIVVLPTPVLGEPLAGVYETLNPIRGSLSWTGPQRSNNGRHGVFLFGSWADERFGEQFLLQCGVQVDDCTVEGNRDEWGNADLTFASVYQGGQFTLAPGLWGSGEGTITNVRVVDTTKVRHGLWTASSLTVEVDGVFASGELFRLSVAQASAFTTDDVVVDGYPPFLDMSCQPVGQFGVAFDGDAILVIEAPIPAQPKSWGNLKAIYR